MGGGQHIVIELHQELTPGQRQELQELQRQLADSAARADLECHSIRDDAGWHDLASVAEEYRECVVTAVRYLALRKLVDIDPAGMGRVRFKNHSEQPFAKVAIHDIDACMGMTCDCMDEEGPEEDVPAQEQQSCM